MLTAAQIETRKTGIGGSDAAAALGVSRWKSPLDLYLEKRGEAPPFEGNNATRWGDYLEPAIRQAYADETGTIVRLPAATLRHETYRWMIFHPDGLTDDGRVLEIKTARSDSDWGEAGSADVPLEYWMQVQHGMIVSGLELADVAVLFGGSDFRIYHVPLDPEAKEMIVGQEAEFWSRVERGDPPPPKTNDDARRLYGSRSLPIAVEASEPIRRAVADYAELRDRIAEAVDLQAEIRAKITLAMGEAEALTYGGQILATWKATKAPERLDVVALRKALPDVAAKFTKTGEPSRRFDCKL